MKKFLLSIAAVVMACLGAKAETAVFYATTTAPVTADYSYQLTGTVADNNYTAGGANIAFTKVNNTASTVNSNLVRFYANDLLTITPTESTLAIKSVQVKCSSKAYAEALALNAPADESLSVNTSTFLVTYASATGVSEVVLKASAQSRFSYILVTYESTAPKDIEDVEISYELDGATAEVTLSCATEGASIYYGYAEDDVTTLYTSPFKVTERCTVYAYAKKDDKESPIKPLMIDLPYTSFKAVIADAVINNGNQVTIIGDFEVISDLGNYTMLTDGVTNMLVYRYTGESTVGTKFSEIKGTVSPYHNLFELQNVEMTEGGNGATYQPYEISSLDAVNYEDNIFDQVILKSCNITGKNGSLATIEFGAETVALNNIFGVVFDNGENYDVTGYVWRDNDNLQIVPVEIVGGAFKETVKTPVISPNKRELQQDEEITITCETEGATIYYTLDDTDPTQDSTPYTGAISFTGDFTVKARAYMEDGDQDMFPSEIASRTYHVFDPTCNVIDNSHETPNKGSYVQHTCTVDGVDYAMMGIHDSKRGIQMNKKQGCYIIQVSENTGYVLKSIVADYNKDGSSNGIQFTVRGSNSVYSDGTSDPSIENNVFTNGVEIGIISEANPKVDFDRDYKYFSFYPSNKEGAAYLNTLTIYYRETAEIAAAPVLPENFGDGIESDGETLLIPELPTHEDWTPMYQVNDGNIYEADAEGTFHDEALDPATLHTIKIWYEHYNGVDKSEVQEFAHMTQPQFTVNAPQLNSENKLQTLIEFGKIGEGVKVYFTLNGTAPVVDETEAPANAIHRAAASGAQYTLDKNEDLDATHVITSATPNVVIKDIATGTANQKMTLTTQAVHESGVKSAVKASEGNAIDIPTGIEEIEAAAGEAIYFDLQGARIARPENGAYIRVLNGKAEKVVK